MSDPTISASIDRTGLALAPLVASGVDGVGVLGLASYAEPGRVARVKYAPSPENSHGEIPLAWSFQQGLLRFEVFADVETEADAANLYAELVAACTQWPTFEVTVDEDGVTKVWTCHPGSVEPAARTRANLDDHDVIWSVALPCYPIPVVS